jgi:mono/diheme cytochrome c family protein
LCLLLAACATTHTAAPTGEQVFATHCAACHGPGGRGDGPVAEAIAVPVPNLRALDARYGGEFPAQAVASYIDGRNLPDAHGTRQMPVWGLVFAATESIVPGAEAPASRIDALLDFLRMIQDP